MVGSGLKCRGGGGASQEAGNPARDAVGIKTTSHVRGGEGGSRERQRGAWRTARRKRVSALLQVSVIPETLNFQAGERGAGTTGLCFQRR